LARIKKTIGRTLPRLAERCSFLDICLRVLEFWDRPQRKRLAHLNGSVLCLAAAAFWLICARSLAENAEGAFHELATDDQVHTMEALLTRYGVPAEAVKRLQVELRKVSLPGFEYPWKGLEEGVTAMPNKRLPLVGYGSLLNRESAARTIKETPAEGYPPVVALGALRVFNYVIPESRLKLDGPTHLPRERAALNVIYTKSPAHALNGRLLMVAPEDLTALREREFGYDLRPVSCLRWLDWNGAPFIAYILVAANSEVDGRRVIDDDALPNPSYSRVCRAGAKAVSVDFLQLYLHTTYLGDRKTTLAVWERDHPELAGNPD
jgi:hypothetical protein